jgi:hypothetical protein
MFTLKVGKAEQYQDIEQNETRLRVPFMILRPVIDEDSQPVLDDSGEAAFEVMTERVESFPITAKLPEVEELLQRHLDVFTEDWQRFEDNKERQAALAQSQEVADKISNLTL